MGIFVIKLRLKGAEQQKLQRKAAPYFQSITDI
jgi:hypothetical protein